MTKERLDKLLVHMNVGSRTEVKALIRSRRVTVASVIATDAGMHVDPLQQQIALDGSPILYQRHFHILLHKPGGVITATEDPKKPTVMDILPQEMRHRNLFPVGRLDKDTEGLLILTTDGELAHRLLSPRWHIDKRYLAVVDLPLSPDDPPAFAAGITLGDGYQCLPSRMEILDSLTALVTVQEGKYHQIRRMFKVMGKEVTYLKRLSMGTLELGGLPRSQARPLTETELAFLYAATGLAHP